MKQLLTLALFSLIGPAVTAQTQTYTTSGTYTVPVGVSSITIEVVGAGGTGGGNGGGGGGGGGYAKGVYTVIPGSTLAVHVGVGGGGPTTGSTSVGTLISATGGANGSTVPNPNLGGGGAGGNGTGGNIVNRMGGSGGGGYWTYFGGGGAGAGGSVSNGGNGVNTITYTPGGCLTPGGAAGSGGGAPGGGGGKGAGFTDSGCNNTDPAGPGLTYGGGGGGGNGNGGQPGTGNSGYCLINAGTCVAPPAPVNTTLASNLMICSNNIATLSATSTGSINWYASPTSTTIIGSGANYITPVLTTTTTFYAEAVTCTTSINRTAITVSVNPSPTVTAVSNASLICTGQQATLTASGAATYTWSTASNGTVITVSPATTTNYVVNGTAANSCSGSFTITQAVSPCTGLNNVSLISNELSAYPNPNSGEFFIKGTKDVILNLVNELGQTIRTISLDQSNNHNATIKNLAPGVYFITGKTDEHQVKQKIIVTK